MRALKLISELKKIVDEHGDLDVYIPSTDLEPTGGVLLSYVYVNEHINDASIKWIELE